MFIQISFPSPSPRPPPLKLAPRLSSLCARSSGAWHSSNLVQPGFLRKLHAGDTWAIGQGAHAVYGLVDLILAAAQKVRGWHGRLHSSTPCPLETAVCAAVSVSVPRLLNPLRARTTSVPTAAAPIGATAGAAGRPKHVLSAEHVVCVQQGEGVQRDPHPPECPAQRRLL